MTGFFAALSLTEASQCNSRVHLLGQQFGPVPIPGEPFYSTPFAQARIVEEDEHLVCVHDQRSVLFGAAR